MLAQIGMILQLPSPLHSHSQLQLAAAGSASAANAVPSNALAVLMVRVLIELLLSNCRRTPCPALMGAVWPRPPHRAMRGGFPIVTDCHPPARGVRKAARIMK